MAVAVEERLQCGWCRLHEPMRWHLTHHVTQGYQSKQYADLFGSNCGTIPSLLPVFIADFLGLEWSLHPNKCLSSMVRLTFEFFFFSAECDTLVEKL